MLIEILVLVGYVFVAASVLIWSLSGTARRHEVDKALRKVEKVIEEKQEKLGGSNRAAEDHLDDDIRRRA